MKNKFEYMLKMTLLMKKIFTMPFPWNTWVLLLAFVNIGGGLYFYSTLEGKFALGAMVGSMTLMQIIFSKYGFVRLLGLGHILFWVPFLTLTISRLQSWNGPSDCLKTWLILVSLLNSISLILDIVDVWRFLRGEKAEM